MRRAALLLALTLAACAAPPPREPPSDLSVEPALLDAWRRVERERRWRADLEARGGQVMCVLYADPARHWVDVVRHRYVAAVRALQAGDEQGGRAHLGWLLEARRWFPYASAEADAVVERARARLAARPGR